MSKPWTNYTVTGGYDEDDGLPAGEWALDPITRVVRWRPTPPPPPDPLYPNRRPNCGTDTGYYAHLRSLREPACEECKSAHRVAERLRQARARIRRLQAESEQMREAS